jgi:hypothetical protein
VYAAVRGFPCFVAAAAAAAAAAAVKHPVLVIVPTRFAEKNNKPSKATGYCAITGIPRPLQLVRPLQ